MDGKAISIGFASSTGPDWLKDMVHSLKQGLKLYNELKELLSIDCPGVNIVANIS